MKGQIHIGTSGWHYKHWKGGYYPEKLPSAQWLGYISRDFNCTEINNSFYKLPAVETVQQWAAQAGPQFRFCPKLHRMVSHYKKLHDPAPSLQLFFQVFDAISPQLGPVLVQLPPRLKFNAAVVQPFYEALSLWPHQFSMEVRDDSWLAAESVALMKRHNIGWVIAQSGQPYPYREMVTARHVYLRFHGPAALYASGYHPLTLRAYARKMKAWADEGHDVWAFFNNDLNGFATRDALLLKRLVEE